MSLIRRWRWWHALRKIWVKSREEGQKGGVLVKNLMDSLTDLLQPFQMSPWTLCISIATVSCGQLTSTPRGSN